MNSTQLKERVANLLGNSHINDWERGFAESVLQQLEKGASLSQPQHNTIQKIEGRYSEESLNARRDWGVSFTGGETVFVHSMAMAGEEASEEEESLGVQSLLPMTAGQIVQPRFGRVVLFTGGEENLHCRMPNAGRAGATRLEETAPRVSVNLWFQCSGR